MNKIIKFYKDNNHYLFFSFLFTFFLICSYIFGYLDGFNTLWRLFIVLLFSLCFTPLTAFFIIKISKIRCSLKLHKESKSKLVFVFECKLFYLITIFFLQLPVFLAFYPGICYYDINTQIEQYQLPYFVTNHPLVHTLFIGFFQGLFQNVNTGYAISVLIQMIIVDSAMAYALHYLYQKKRSMILCSFGILFYGLFPINSLLTISTTKDIFFSAFVLIFIIDIMRLYSKDLKYSFYICFIINAILMLLLRNNAIYAFVPSTLILLIIIIKKREDVKKYLILFVLVFIGYIFINGGLTFTLHAVPGSIKETLSIPCQQMARIYMKTDDTEVKENINDYIQEPDKYCYYLSDAIKQQLPFDVLDSSCKHFLLDTAINDLKYPIICIDAAFYNVQGYWDLFHSPYQSEHFFLAANDYRGGATLDSKFTSLKNLYVDLFYRSDRYDETFFSIFFGNAFYIWMFLFFFIKAIKEKNRQGYFGCLFPFFYLLTLLLGPGAIIRYGYVFILIAPVVLSSFISDTSTIPEELIQNTNCS